MCISEKYIQRPFSGAAKRRRFFCAQKGVFFHEHSGADPGHESCLGHSGLFEIEKPEGLCHVYVRYLYRA